MDPEGVRTRMKQCSKRGREAELPFHFKCSLCYVLQLLKSFTEVTPELISSYKSALADLVSLFPIPPGIFGLNLPGMQDCETITSISRD